MIADLTPHRLSPQVVVAPFDPAVGAALAGVGTDPDLPTYLDASLTVPLDHDSPVARRQDALAAMLWRALQPETEPRTQILLPPLKWSPQPDDAQAMLTALATTIRSGLAVPRPLPAVIAESAALPPDANPGAAGRSDDPRGRFDDDVVDEHRGHGRPAVGTDRRADHRPAHRADRPAVHRAAARGHAAGAEPDRAAGRPATTWPASG